MINAGAIEVEAPLERVSFKKGVERKARLSAPYVPGRRSDRFWKEDWNQILRTYYPTGGLAACAAHLPPHKTSKSSIYGQVKKLGLRKANGAPRRKLDVPADIDDILRREYELQDGKKRGAINAIADKLRLPRWWVTQRAIKLGLTMPHKKDPPWTAAETALMHKVPLHDLDKCAEIFRQHGFRRSPTAIMVRAKRLELSRRFREGYTAGQAAAIVGFDSKNFGTMIAAGEVKATRRHDNRLPQQGRSRWIITQADLRAFAIAQIDRIDLRKVDKHGFVQLLIDAPLEREAAAAPAPAIAARPKKRKRRRRRPLSLVDRILRGKL